MKRLLQHKTRWVAANSSLVASGRKVFFVFLVAVAFGFLLGYLPLTLVAPIERGSRPSIGMPPAQVL